jgi:hypothetical protein
MGRKLQNGECDPTQTASPVVGRIVGATCASDILGASAKKWKQDVRDQRAEQLAHERRIRGIMQKQPDQLDHEEQILLAQWQSREDQKRQHLVAFAFDSDAAQTRKLDLERTRAYTM